MKPPPEGWFWTANSVFDRLVELGRTALLVYCVLARLSDRTRVCQAAVGTIATRAKLTTRGVRGVIPKLVDAGLVIVEPVRKGKADRANRYRLPPYPPGEPPFTPEPGFTRGLNDDSAPPEPGFSRGLNGHSPPGLNGGSPIQEDLLAQDVPIQDGEGTDKKDARVGDADLETSRWMFQLLLKLNPRHKPPKFETWARTIRLMRERDGRTDEEIHTLFAWCHQDSFERTVVLSTDSLRKRFDALETKRRVSKNGKGKRNGRSPTGGSQYNENTKSDIGPGA